MIDIPLKKENRFVFSSLPSQAFNQNNSTSTSTTPPATHVLDFSL